jgi:hypothetical protein
MKPTSDPVRVEMTALSEDKQKDHSEIGGIFIFVGGILALIFPVFPLTLTLLLRQDIGEWFESVGGWIMGGGSGLAIRHLPPVIMLFIGVGAIATVAFGALAVSAYTWVRRGNLRDGGLVAILAGVAMISTVHWIPGFITVIGGTLCYRSRQSSETRARVNP